MARRDRQPEWFRPRLNGLFPRLRRAAKVTIFRLISVTTVQNTVRKHNWSLGTGNIIHAAGVSLRVLGRGDWGNIIRAAGAPVGRTVELELKRRDAPIVL